MFQEKQTGRLTLCVMTGVATVKLQFFGKLIIR